MSEDHKPSREDEAQRIRDAGGFIINNRLDLGSLMYIYMHLYICVNMYMYISMYVYEPPCTLLSEI
jgi:hypothetical protein